VRLERLGQAADERSRDDAGSGMMVAEAAVGRRVS
jgi:hypothetical protein